MHSCRRAGVFPRKTRWLHTSGINLRNGHKSGIDLVINNIVGRILETSSSLPNYIAAGGDSAL